MHADGEGATHDGNAHTRLCCLTKSKVLDVQRTKILSTEPASSQCVNLSIIA